LGLRAIIDICKTSVGEARIVKNYNSWFINSTTRERERGRGREREGGRERERERGANFKITGYAS
jgi:hypothetical protein